MCHIACLQPGVARLTQHVHVNACLIVSSGAQFGFGLGWGGVHVFVFVSLDLESSEPIHEDKAIKWEKGFASRQRWLPRICEWIRQKGHMNDCMSARTMNESAAVCNYLEIP